MTKQTPIREHFTEAQIQQLKSMGIEVETLEHLRSFAESFVREISDSFSEYADTSTRIEDNGEEETNGDS